MSGVSNRSTQLQELTDHSSHRDRILKIGYRCRRRGTRELEILLGRFAERHVDELDCAELGMLEEFLEEADSDLLDWILGRTTCPGTYAKLTVTIRRIAIEKGQRTE